MKNMKVSIIVPVYNVEKYLSECINSIISQTYSNIEIILIDDGSTDKSGFFCDAQANKDKRIKVIHQKNQGLSGARNTGIDIATGAYITFVDADDVIDSLYIEYLISSIEDCEISVCDFLHVPEDYKYVNKGENHRAIIEPIYLTNVSAITEVYNSKFHGIDFIACAKLYKLSMFKENNIVFPERRFHEDTYTTYKLFYQANKIVYIDEDLYFYRQRKGSITKSKLNKKRYCDLIEGTLEECEYFLNANEYKLLELSFYDYMRKVKGVIREMVKDKSIIKSDLIGVCKSLRKEINHYKRLIHIPIKKIIYYKTMSYIPILSKL